MIGFVPYGFSLFGIFFVIAPFTVLTVQIMVKIVFSRSLSFLHNLEFHELFWSRLFVIFSQGWMKFKVTFLS